MRLIIAGSEFGVMRRFEKTKVFITVGGAVLAIILLFFGINIIEDKMDQRAYAENFDEDEDDEEEDYYELAEDEIKIGSTIYKFDSSSKNYLIIGTDKSGSTEDDNEYHGKMADFLLLVTINRLDNNYAFLQIDRDTVTEVPMMTADGTAYAKATQQICTAHYYGGNEEESCENTVDAVSLMLGGIPIEGYYSLNMEQIPKLNHIVGGVTVTVSSDLTAADPTLIEGETITLSDEQAYNYVHSRMNVADGSNQDRMRRQHEYMDGYLQKIIDNTKANPNFPNVAFKEMMDCAQTNMSGNDISKILNRISQGENLGIKTFEGAHKLGMLLGDGIEHQEFYIDYDSFLNVMTELYKLEEVRSVPQAEEEESEEEE